MLSENIPIIVGVGDCLDRTEDFNQAKESVVLIAEALKKAQEDTGVENLLSQIEYIKLVNIFSWPYPDPALALGKHLPSNPHRVIEHGPIGGETPVKYINEMAQAIAKGQIEIAAVCGGEAERTAYKAKREGVVLKHWTSPKKEVPDNEDMLPVNPLAAQYGLKSPIQVYPLYENALYKSFGQSFTESQNESALLWHQMSKVAAKNPYAWIQEEKSIEEIKTPSAQNRMISFPYPKLMIANNSVNSSSALILMSVRKAREMKIPKEKWIYIGAGSAAHEPKDFLKRDNYSHSAAMEAVLTTVMDRNHLDIQDLAALELYSCFPCIPKMARRILNLPLDHPITEIGGLTFAGAALNNYMTGAATAAVRKLRKQSGKALLYGNGEFVTHHHALVFSKNPIDPKTTLMDSSVQVLADKKRKEVPELLETYEGPAILETYTVIYNRQGPDKTVIIAKTPKGQRFLAKLEESDREGLEKLLNPVQSLVGEKGMVMRKNPFNIWKFVNPETIRP